MKGGHSSLQPRAELWGPSPVQIMVTNFITILQVWVCFLIINFFNGIIPLPGSMGTFAGSGPLPLNILESSIREGEED